MVNIRLYCGQKLQQELDVGLICIYIESKRAEGT